MSVPVYDVRARVWVCNCLLAHFAQNITTQIIIIYIPFFLLIIRSYWSSLSCNMWSVLSTFALVWLFSFLFVSLLLLLFVFVFLFLCLFSFCVCAFCFVVVVVCLFVCLFWVLLLLLFCFLFPFFSALFFCFLVWLVGF